MPAVSVRITRIAWFTRIPEAPTRANRAQSWMRRRKGGRSALPSCRSSVFVVMMCALSFGRSAWVRTVGSVQVLGADLGRRATQPQPQLLPAERDDDGERFNDDPATHLRRPQAPVDERD